MPLKGLVLDMDGVIVDSELQWKLAEGPFFREVVPAWMDADHDKIVGLSPEDLYRFLASRYPVSHTLGQFLALCDELAQDIYRRRVSLPPALPPFLEKARAEGLSLAIASSSPRPWIDLVLERFALAPFFAAVASGDETPGRTKPHPDLYQLAVRRLALAPAECLAIEDSSVGARAAKAAGLSVAGYRNGHNESQDLSAADAVFSDFATLDYAAVSSRLSRACAPTKADH